MDTTVTNSHSLNQLYPDHLLCQTYMFRAEDVMMVERNPPALGFIACQQTQIGTKEKQLHTERFICSILLLGNKQSAVG